MQKSVHIRLMFPAAGNRGGMEDGRREEMRRVIEKSFFPGFSFCYFPCELLLLSGALLFLAFCSLSATLLLFFLLVLSPETQPPSLDVMFQREALFVDQCTCCAALWWASVGFQCAI